MLDSLKYCAPTLIFSGFFGLPHICDPPAAAVAVIAYPESHAEQSTPAMSQRVPADPVATVGVPFGQVHVLATLAATKLPPVIGQVIAHETYPVAAGTDTVPRPATPVAVAVVTTHPTAVHAAALALALQTFRTAVPSAGIFHPVLGVQQTA